MSTNRRRLTVVALSMAAAGTLHFLLDGRDASDPVWHMLFAKLYFFPVLFGALWFGLPGGVGAATAASTLYAFHLWRLWPRTPLDFVDHAGEAMSFLVFGTVAGFLVTLERRARNRSLRALRRAEREKIGAAVAALTETLSARDPETLEHSRRVSELAGGFAAFLGLSKSKVRSLQLAGLLHDIGKVGVPDDILLKAESLSPEERRKIMEHPGIGEKILSPVGFEKVVEAIAAHHESVDGSGYPKGLKGEEISEFGRILAIVDTYDALGSQRPYRTPLDGVRIRELMRSMAGKKLDGALLEKFLEYEAARKPA